MTVLNNALEVRDMFYARNYSEFSVNGIYVKECTVREDGALYIMAANHSEAVFGFDVEYKVESDDYFTNSLA